MGSFLVVKTKTAINQSNLLKNFTNRFADHVTGILNGLDRARFRATLLSQAIHDLNAVPS
jgi:hypothetical protein